MTYKFGDIVLLKFPFTDGETIKYRPAVILKDTKDNDLIVARVTSHLKKSPYDIDIIFWEKAGLKLPSIIRIHKIATLDAKLVKKELGILQNEDVINLKATLIDLLN